MPLRTPSADLQIVFSEKFSKLNQSGSFSACQSEDEMLFFLDSLNLKMHQPSLIIKPSSKFVIGVNKVGFNFYTIDSVVKDSFIGEKIQTHIHYILSPSAISFLHGYLSAIAQGNKS